MEAADPRRARAQHLDLLMGQAKLGRDEAFEWGHARRREDDLRSRLGGFRRELFWNASDLLADVDQIANREDLYIGMSIRRCPRGMSFPCGCPKPFNEEHVRGLLALFADVDVKPGAYATLDAALAAIDALPCEPTYIVTSGGGLQPVWVMDSALDDVDRAKALLRAIRDRLRSDATVDATRVLRLAGTTNWKPAYGPSGAPTGILRVSDVRYRPEQLEASFPAKARTKGAPHRESTSDGSTFVLRWDANPPVERLEQLIRRNPKFSDSWEHRRDDLLDQSPSAYDLSLAWYAANDGWGNQEIVDLLIAHRRRHNGEPKLRPDYYERTLKTARASARDEAPPYDQASSEDALVINVGDGDLHRVTELVWTAIQRANDPPAVFRHGDVLVRLEAHGGQGPVLRPLTQDTLRQHVAAVASLVKIHGKRQVPAYPPRDVIANMLAVPGVPLPILTRLTHAPIVAPDGSLILSPGYHQGGGIYYAPTPGFELQPIPDHPTREHVERAKEILLHELLGDFPFATQAHCAHAAGLFLVPFVRELIAGPIPLHLIEKPTPGSGATLLTSVLLHPSIGDTVAMMTEGGSEDEWRKRITAKLLEAPVVVVVDNVREPLASGALASAITSATWEDRHLGLSKIIHVDVRCVWIATGNNPRLSDEIDRRTVRIRLDPQCENPWGRVGFRHADLRQWVADHRSELVWAGLVLARFWVVEGRPIGTRALGGFEGWAGVIGGILEVAGIPAFLGDREHASNDDPEDEAYAVFFSRWWHVHEDRPVSAGDLVELATEAGLDLGDGAEKLALGRNLHRHRDRVIGHLKLVRDRNRHGSALWRLVRVTQ
jgi:hypothetical protein